MAKRKSGGGAAAVGGAVALLCGLLAVSGNFETAVDTITDGWDVSDLTTPSDSDPAPGDGEVSDETDTAVTIPSSVTAPTAARARDLLGGLPEGERVSPSDSTYDRDAYGEAWADIDGNGCSQRQDVLHTWLDQEQPSDVRTRGACDHEVYGGTWHDPYTGRTITLTDAKDPGQAQTVQIDHIVPLQEAHHSGAGDWTSSRRAEFANDTTNLVPVYGPANASKGGDDAAAWRPRQQHQCDYARRYTAVKAKWNLTVDTSERDALADMLDTCTD